MWCKLVFVAYLAVGVLARSELNDVSNPHHDPYDQESQMVATQLCQATYNATNKDNVPEVKESIKTSIKCFANIFDANAISLEIHETRGTEAFDGVVKKYCAKSPQLKVCISDLSQGLAPCLPPEAVRISKNSIFAVIDFLCNNDGARIVSFVKEGGVDCIEQKNKNMEMAVCQREAESNFTKISSVHGGGLTELLFIPDKEKCILVGNAMSCFTNVLTGCSNKTPGRLARELQDVLLDTCNAAAAPNSGIINGCIMAFFIFLKICFVPAL